MSKTYVRKMIGVCSGVTQSTFNMVEKIPKRKRSILGNRRVRNKKSTTHASRQKRNKRSLRLLTA